jgi:pyruvate/2-oxoglutarate dehydrogenase complex dihydrolipoamide dehydrogenase (E3) component
MAQAFSRLGSQVQVVQRSGQILSKEDKDVADTVMQSMEAEGVIFHLDTTVQGGHQEGTGTTITIADGQGREKIVQAEAVLLAQGRTPNLGGLNLDGIGVESTGRGITVDNRMRTSQKHIYAPGDINGSFQFTHAAGYEGGVVIANAVFHLPRKPDYTWMPWCTYSDPELASIGMNEKRAKAAGIDYSVWTEEFSGNDRALAEGSEVGKVKMLLDAKEKLIGVQILGPHAGDLLGEWTAVANGGVKLSTLAGAVHPYPTLGEINKRVAGTYLSPKLFSERVKKGLKLIFQLKGPVEQPCSRLK